MDVTTITTLIGSFGFPIVACILMGWYVKYTTDKYSAQVEALNNKHSEEMKSVTEALNNNTLALQKLCDRIGDDTE